MVPDILDLYSYTAAFKAVNLLMSMSHAADVLKMYIVSAKSDKVNVTWKDVFTQNSVIAISILLMLLTHILADKNTIVSDSCLKVMDITDMQKAQIDEMVGMIMLSKFANGANLNLNMIVNKWYLFSILVILYSILILKSLMKSMDLGNTLHMALKMMHEVFRLMAVYGILLVLHFSLSTYLFDEILYE